MYLDIRLNLRCYGIFGIEMFENVVQLSHVCSGMSVIFLLFGRETREKHVHVRRYTTYLTGGTIVLLCKHIFRGVSRVTRRRSET